MTLYKVFGRNSARNRFLVVSGSFYAYTIDAYAAVFRGRAFFNELPFVTFCRKP